MCFAVVGVVSVSLVASVLVVRSEWMSKCMYQSLRGRAYVAGTGLEGVFDFLHTNAWKESGGEWG